MERSKEGESGMFSRSFPQEDFGEDDDDEGEHFIISLEDNGDECELLDEFDGSLPSSKPVQETGDPRYGSLHTPPAVPAPGGGLDQGILPAQEKTCSNQAEQLGTGVASQGSTSASGSGQSDLPLPPPFCPQWEVAGGFEPRPGGEGERNVVSGGRQMYSNPVSVIPAASAAAGNNGKNLETVQLDGGSGGIWSEAVFLSTSEGVSDKSMYTGEKVNDQSREKNEIAMESSLCENQNSKLEKMLPPNGTVVSGCGMTVCVDSEGLKESMAGKRSESAVSFSQTENGKESDQLDLNLPACVFENNLGASSCHGSGQCTCVMCYKGRGIVDWFPEPESQGDEGNLVTTNRKPGVASRKMKTESQRRSRKQNLSMVSQPDVVFRKTPTVVNGQLQVKTRQLLPEPVQQKPVIISIPEACRPLLFKQSNTSQILMVPANSQTLTPSSDTIVNKNAHIISTNLPSGSQERCFLLQTFPSDVLPKSLNAEVSGKSQPVVSKSSGVRPVNSGGSSKQHDVTKNRINNVIPAWFTKNQNNALGLSGAPLNHKPVQASKPIISNVVSLLPGKTAQGQSTTQFIPLSPQILPKPTSILTKAPKYSNPVGVPVSSHNIPLPPPLYCAPEKQASTGGQFIPVSKSLLIGKPSSSLSKPSVFTSHTAVSGTQVVILKTGSTGLASLSSAVTCSNVLSENQVILAPPSGKLNQHQAMYVTSTSKNAPVSLVSTSDRSVSQAPKKMDLSQPGKMIITLEHQKDSVKSLRGSEVSEKMVLGKSKRSLLKDSPCFGQSNNSSSAVAAGDNVHQMTLMTTNLVQQGPNTASSKFSDLAKDSKPPEQNSLSSILSLLNQPTQLTSTASTVRSQKTSQSPKKMELTQTLIQLIKSHLNSPTSGKDEQGLLQAVKGLVETTELQTALKQKSGPAENMAGSVPGVLAQPQANCSVGHIASRPSLTDLPQQSPSCNGGAEPGGHIKTILPSPKPPSEGLPSSYIEDWVQQSREYVASCKDQHKTSLLKDTRDSPTESESDWTLPDKDSEKHTGKVSAVRRTSAPAAGSSSCPVSQFNFDECQRETLILPCPKKPGSSKSRKISTLSLNSVLPSGGPALQMNTKKTPSASVIPGDKGLKLKIKLNEKASTSLSAEAVRKDRSDHQYSNGKVAGSSTLSENVSSEFKTEEVQEAAGKPRRGETAEEMFQRFQEQAMQQVFNAQFGVGHVGRSLRPMRTTMSFADKLPPTLVDQQKKKKLEEDKKEEGGKKKAKEGVQIKEGPKKVTEPLIGKENVMKKKAFEGTRRKKPASTPEPSFEKKLTLEDCPRLQQDNSVPWKKEIYCNNILAGHKVFVKFNIFENPVSEKFFLVPFFNLGGSRTQFDKEDMGYISKAVAQVENEKRTCARHLSYHNREGGKATFFRKANTSQALTEKDYHKYSFTLKGFYPEAPKRHQPVEEKWTVDSKIEIEIDRAEVEDEGDCNLENEVADGALSNDILDKGESLRLSSSQGGETSSGLRVNHVSGSSQLPLPCDAHSGGKHIPGCLALSEPIQVPAFLPPGKEENGSCVRLPTPKTSESLCSGKDVEKSVTGEILVKDKEENSVSGNVSEECAYTERLREMLLKENCSLSLEESTALPVDAPTLKYDDVLKGSSLSPCGIKFFQEIKLEKPDDGYEDSMIPFPSQVDGGTQNGADNLDIQDTDLSSLALEANTVNSPKSSVVQEVHQVTIKQEPKDDGYLLATGTAAVSDSAGEANAVLPQTEPVPCQTTAGSEVMVSGSEEAKEAEDCGNNDKELGSLDLGSKPVEDVTGEEGKRTAAESEDNTTDSPNKINEEDESKKNPTMPESPLSSSSVSESSDLSSSSEVSSSDLEGTASNEEEDSEEETDKTMEVSSSTLPHPGASSTDLTQGGTEKNPVQKKISSLVESLRLRLTQDKPPLPQWLVPDVKWKPENRKRKKKRRKQLEESGCSTSDTTIAAETIISEPLAPICSTATVCEPTNAVLSAPTVSESGISTHSTAPVSEPAISVCTTASISEPTVSFSSTSISSPVPFSVSGNSVPYLTSSSQNCTVANASNTKPSTSLSSLANPTAILSSACEAQKNNEGLQLESAVTSDLTPSVPLSLGTHKSSVVTLEPTISVLSTAAGNSLYTSSATATICSVLSLSTTPSVSPSNVTTLSASLVSASAGSAGNATLPSVTKESSIVMSHSSSPFQSSGSMLLPVMRPGECKTATPHIPQLNGKSVQTSRPESALACSMQAAKTVSLPSVELSSVGVKESLALLVGDFTAASSKPLQSAANTHTISFGSDLQDSVKKEVECDSNVTPAIVDIVSENCPTVLEKTVKTEDVGVNIRAHGVSGGTEKVNSPLCIRSNRSTPVSDFDVDVGEDDSPEDALSFKPIIVTPDLQAASALEKDVRGSQEFELLASSDLGFSPASSRSESPLNSRIVQDNGDKIVSKNVEEGQPKGFRFPFLQRKERKALKRERKPVQTKSTEKASIASYLCEKFAINIVPVVSNSKRPKVTSDDKPVADKNAPLNARPNSLPTSLPSVSKTPSLDQIFGTEVDKSLLNKVSGSSEKLDKSEPKEKSKNGKTAQVARKGITGKRRRPQIKPAESPASYTWRQLSRQSSKSSNLIKEEPAQSEFSDVVVHPCRVVLRRLEDMNLGPSGLPMEEIEIKQEIEDVVDSDTPSSSSKARRLVNRKKRKRGSTKQARKHRPREKKDIVDYYASMLESLQRKAQLLEEETKRKEMEEEQERKRKELEEEEKRRKEAEECKKEETVTNLEPAEKEKLNNSERSESGSEDIVQQKLGDLSTEEKLASIETELRKDQEQNSEPSLKEDIGEQSSGFEASIVENDGSETVTQREQTDERIGEENAALQRPEVEPMDSIAPVNDRTPQEKNSVEDTGDMMEPVSGACSSGQISASHEDVVGSERAASEGESATEESNSPDLSAEAAPPQRLCDAAEEQREDTSVNREAEEENSVLEGGCCLSNGDNVGVETKNHESQADVQFSSVVSDVSALKMKKEQTPCVESHPVPSGFEKKDVLLAGCDVEESGAGETKSGEISEAEEDFLLGDELGGEGLVAIPEEEVEKLLGLDSHERMDMLESLEMEDDDDDEERPLMIDEGDVTDFMDISGASDKDSATQKLSSECGLSSDHEDSSLKEEPSGQTCTLSPPPSKKSAEALLQVSPSWKRLLGAESLRQSRQEVETTVRKAEISELRSEETMSKHASNNFRFKLKLPPGAVSKALRLSTEMKQVFGEEESAEDIRGMAESVEENEDGAAAMLGSETEAESESSEKGDNHDNKAENNRQPQPPIPKLKMKLDSAIQMVKSEFLKEGKKLGNKSTRDSPKHCKDVVTTAPTDEEVQFQLDMQFYLGKDVAEGLCKIEPMVNGSGGASGVGSGPSENLEKDSVVTGKTEAVRQTRAQSCKDKNSIVENDSVRITRSKRNNSGSRGAEEKGASASPSVRSRKVKPSPKRVQSVSPDAKEGLVGQSEVASEESVGIFSNATLFKTEDSTPKVRQSSAIKPLTSKSADQLLKKNAFDIHRLKMKLNPLLKGTLGKMKKEPSALNVQKGSLGLDGVGTDRVPSPSKVNGSTTKVKDSESAFQKSVSDLGKVMQQLREKRLSLKSMERSNPGDMQTSAGRCGEEEKVISKECAVSSSEAVSEVSSNPSSSTSLPKINTAKLSNLLKSFKKPVVTNPGLKEPLILAGDGDGVSKEEGKSVEENAMNAGVTSNVHRTLKRKRGNKDLSLNESARHNGTFKVPKVSAEGKSLAKDKEAENEEKGERSFFDCLPNLMPAVWEEA